MAKVEVSFSETQVSTLSSLPTSRRLSQSFQGSPEIFLVVYDRKLVKNQKVSDWLKSFQFSYAVKAGESLKDLDDFPKHLKKIFKMLGPVGIQKICFVSLGGGTVGDYTGFLASVFKRGVPVIHIPSTLLAAIDSAHGGKTALNVGEFKNQVGSFHHPREVLLVRELLESLPRVQIQSALGELLKMSFISGGELFEKFRDSSKLEFPEIWKLMPLAIQGKYKILALDPDESKGLRQVLNLGHSLGHVLESYYGLFHGLAVALGTEFAIHWSFHRGFLKKEIRDQVLALFLKLENYETPEKFFKHHRRMGRSKFQRLLFQDKKLKDSQNLNFVFLHGPGQPIRKSVTLESVLNEAERQKWI